MSRSSQHRLIHQPSHSLLLLVASFPSIFCSVGNAQALPPLPPIYPTSPQQCQQFSISVEAYASAVVKEHEECLAKHKPDPSNSSPESGNVAKPSAVCSRSACQYLHDVLYGPDFLSPLKRGRLDVGKCYSQVTDYLARQTQQKSKQHDTEDISPRLLNPFGNDGTETTNTANENLRSKQAKEAATVIARSAAKYIQDAAKGWTNTDDKGFKAPLKLMLEGLKAAKTAARGDVPTTIEPLGKLAEYLEGERQFLSTLASKRESEWLENSGLNNQDRSTIPTSRAYLDDWSNRLAKENELIKSFVPIVERGRDVLERLAVPRMSIEHNTLPGLDALAADDLVHSLNDCSRQIAKIEERLRLARSVVY